MYLLLTFSNRLHESYRRTKNVFTFLGKIGKYLIESESKRKYLLYAIGEIALVVIGILIALHPTESLSSGRGLIIGMRLANY